MTSKGQGGPCSLWGSSNLDLGSWGLWQSQADGGKSTGLGVRTTRTESCGLLVTSCLCHQLVVEDGQITLCSGFSSTAIK